MGQPLRWDKRLFAGSNPAGTGALVGIGDCSLMYVYELLQPQQNPSGHGGGSGAQPCDTKEHQLRADAVPFFCQQCFKKIE